MARSSLRARVGALAAAGATLLFQGGAARAQSACASDEDCGAGYVCKTESYQSCSGGVSCDEDGNCTMEPGECETYEQSWCASATCASNDDCPDHMLCQPQSNWICEGGMGGAGTGAGGASGASGASAGTGGAGGFACGPEGCPEPVCHEEPAPSLCIPRHQLPCEEASDCGGGFDCVESYYYECSGSGAGAAGTGMGGGGGVAGTGETGGSGEPGECTQVPSGQSYCDLQDLPCESDSECPAGLSCEEHYEYPPCMIVGGSGGTSGTGVGGTGGTGGAGGTAGMYAGAGGAAGSTAGTGAGGDDTGDIWECPPPVVSHRCYPYAPNGGGTGGLGGVGGGPVGGTGGASGDNGGIAGFGGAGGAAGTGAENPGSGNAGNGGASDDDGASDEHGHHHGRGKGWLKKLLGCSAGGPASGDASIGWLTLGLAAVVLRRRARRS